MQRVAQGSQFCAPLVELRLGALHRSLGSEAVFHVFQGFPHCFRVKVGAEAKIMQAGCPLRARFVEPLLRLTQFCAGFRLTGAGAVEFALRILQRGFGLDAQFAGGIGFAAGFQHLPHSLRQ